MIIGLRTFFSVVLLSMIGVTSWAGWQVPLWEIPRSVGGHPWFIATLGDAYWGFFTFFVWLSYKEPSWLSRALWLIAIVLLGNMAMAVYGLAVTFTARPDASPSDVLLRATPIPPKLPALLIAAFGIVGGIAAAT